MVGAVNLVLLGVPYAVEIPAAWVAPFIAICGVLSFSSWAIIHNHIHVRTFRARWLNQVGAMLVSLTVGHPATGLVLTHIQNHHVHVGGEADWSRPANAGDGWGGLRLLRYAAVTPVRMGPWLAAPRSVVSTHTVPCATYCGLTIRAAATPAAIPAASAASTHHLRR